MSASPAASLRRRQTEIRKLLRGGFTKHALLRRAMEGWKDAGRDALTDIANALALRGEGASRPLPEHLSTLPGLTEKIKAKREAKFEAALRALRKVRGGWRAREGDDDDDEEEEEEEEETRAKKAEKDEKKGGGGDGDAAFVAALTEVDAVVDALRALLDGDDDDLAALLDPDDAATTTTTRGRKKKREDEIDDPPFGGASASTLLDMLERATEAYREDYFVKRETLDAVLDAAASATREKEKEKEKSRGGRGTDDEGGEARGEGSKDQHSLDLSHETLTTLVATWILSPAIDDDAVDEFAAIAARETSAT